MQTELGEYQVSMQGTGGENLVFKQTHVLFSIESCGFLIRKRVTRDNIAV